MARQEIDLTTPQPNGKMGEPTKSAWEKVNDMTEELYNNDSSISSTATDALSTANSANATANSALAKSNSSVRLSGNGYSPGNDANNPGGAGLNGLQLYGFLESSINTPKDSWCTLASFSPFPDNQRQFQIAYNWNYGDSFSMRFIGGAWCDLWHSRNTTVDSNNFIKRS